VATTWTAEVRMSCRDEWHGKRQLDPQQLGKLPVAHASGRVLHIGIDL
jgi:hypothetical protein